MPEKQKSVILFNLVVLDHYFSFHMTQAKQELFGYRFIIMTFLRHYNARFLCKMTVLPIPFVMHSLQNTLDDLSDWPDMASVRQSHFFRFLTRFLCQRLKQLLRLFQQI